MTDFSVIIVAQDPLPQVMRSLLSVRQKVKRAEFIVVSNGLSESLAGLLSLSQLQPRLIAFAHMVSLSAAFNAGLDAATTGICLVTRSDVLLDSDPADAACHLSKESSLGVVCPKLYPNSDKPRRLLSAGYQADNARLAVTALAKGAWDDVRDSRLVDAGSSACMLIKRDSTRFDERYWFRLEDVDYCYQSAQQGRLTEIRPGFEAVKMREGLVERMSSSPVWCARQLATQWLHHSRWCSDAPLSDHPLQTAVRGVLAEAHLREVDQSFLAQVGAGGKDLSLPWLREATMQ